MKLGFGAGGSRTTALRTGLIVGSIALMAAVFLWTNHFVNKLSEEINATSRVLARFCAQASFPAIRDPELEKVFGQLVASLDFPIVITDTAGTPRAWRGVSVHRDSVPASSIDSLDFGRTISPVIHARIERVRAEAARLDRHNTPIEMRQPGTGVPLGKLHYGIYPVLERLRWMPYVSLGGVVLLLGIGLLGLSSVRQAEKRTIWVGMAKETAHQLGTPLSSLMGWIELLRGHVGSAPEGGDAAIPRAEFEDTLSEMEVDVERLNKVAQRFSRVGSTPNLQLRDVAPVVVEAVHYMRKRLPQASGYIELVERYDEVPPVNLNPELLEWALENIISNAVSAIEKPPGTIEVTVERRKQTEAVEIVVRDSGRGMTPPEQRRAFEPGYTTKPRGWGLGLALARRVVEEYHGGRLTIRHSAPGQGTTVVIAFPN
jgi:two-component system, NtrC family, sensor histidine kinase KinB